MRLNQENSYVRQSGEVLLVPVPCFPLVPVYMMPAGAALIGGRAHVTTQLCTFDSE